jgi:16S rRNA (cytosine1402-N4)-methyltransferase
MPDENPASEPSGPRPPRRRRYKGTHPQHFDEKYKEHDPARYPDTMAKVIASGKTPAGTHRPILVDEVLRVLAPKPGETVVDATVGYGGHAQELWRAVQPGGQLLALDVDPLELPKTEARLREAGLPENACRFRQGNFAGLARLLAAEGIPGADVILADLGVSSMQLDDPKRGFSYKHHALLDLRMNPKHGPLGGMLLSALNPDRLARLLERNADEPNARMLAEGLVEIEETEPLLWTTALAKAVRRVLAAQGRPLVKETCDATIRRVFQALRVEVNDEFSALETFLRYLPECLKPGGRVAILTFHSGEDRRVKFFFEEGRRKGAYAHIAEEITRPSREEVRANPRSSSAKLRWAVRATDSTTSLSS